MGQTAAGCQARAEAAWISIASELPAESVWMAVDGLRLQRAMTNLVANAVEASRPGQEVRMVLTADHRQAVILVKDQGMGMDAETLENVFIPFNTRKLQGTGLGMAIAKKVIEAHGGQILIEPTGAESKSTSNCPVFGALFPAFGPSPGETGLPHPQGQSNGRSKMIIHTILNRLAIPASM